MSGKRIKVVVAGAIGKMGQEVVRMVQTSENLHLVGAVDRSQFGIDVGHVIGIGTCGVQIQQDLTSVIAESLPDVIVDFTIPKAVMRNAELAMKLGVRPVIGTTGLSTEDLKQIAAWSDQWGVGCVVAPNFSIGAILMMEFARQAAKYMPHVEIIEYHGDQKLDAPSGTSLKTAEMIAESRSELKQGNPTEVEHYLGARGAEFGGFRIHSVRLPGVFAQQEVVFASAGETLKIRHDSYERAAYMPGVKVAIEKVMDLHQLVYGFEHLMD